MTEMTSTDINPAKKKRTKCPATMLSIRYLTAEGWLCEKVEHYTAHVGAGQGFGKTHDLFGFVDIIAIRPGETLAVQTTSYPNVSSRVRKIAESEHVGAVREAGWRIVVHGWHQEKRGARWTLKREVDCS